MQKFERRGLVFCPPGFGWARTHGQNPFTQDLGGGRVRVHFCCRDECNRSRGGSIDLTWDALATPTSPRTDPRMTLDLGAEGAFDDSGAMPHSIVDVDSRLYLYYTGWSMAAAAPFSFHIGLAVSDNGGETFDRISPDPVLGPDQGDPYINGAPFVVREGDRFRMWYSAGTGWDDADPPKPRYTIKHAWSDDGVRWQTSDHPCIERRPGEDGLARPVVYRRNGEYRMLFSFRGDQGTYRVGNAVSRNAINWKRVPERFLDVAEDGWDSEMVCYAWPFERDGDFFLVYNGNGYGADGFGVCKFISSGE